MLLLSHEKTTHTESVFYGRIRIPYKRLVIMHLREELMIYKFGAKKASSIKDFDTFTTGVYGTVEYISFQRHEVHGHEDEEGVYVEFNDQLHGGEDVVEKVILTKDTLLISLSAPLFQLDDATGFEVALDITDEEFGVLSKGLEFVFWDNLERLEINA